MKTHLLKTASGLAMGLALALAGPASAQDGWRPCGTSQMIEQSLNEHPELRENVRRLQAATDAYNQAHPLNARAMAPGDPFLTVPVVFHIMHNNGPENISDAQVFDAMDWLNKDYARAARDTGQVTAMFKPIVGTTNFNFILAKRDPNGNCTNGITRHVYANTNSAGEDMKDIVSWDTQKYLNVWVANNLSSGAGGYSFYPGTTSQSHEGVVLRAQQTGSIGYSCGQNLCTRSLTHEVGHFFNLIHTWGSTNTPGVATNCNIDDDVTDTPNTVGTTTSCPLGLNTCGPIANVENFMDYSECTKMFTQGQSARMRIAANAPIAGRNNLWSASNLAATGVLLSNSTCIPQVALSLDNPNTCPGLPVAFRAQISNAPVDTGLHVTWRFDGGTPATSTDLNPTVTYATQGRYNVTLLARNSAGVDSAVQTSAVFVSSNSPAYLPYQSEDFEATDFPQVNSNPFNIWTFDNGGATAGWANSNLAAYSGVRALRAYPGSIATGTKLAAMSPSYDLSACTGCVLEYKYAAARRVATNTDVFKVYTSTNCGRNWTARISRQGTTGATAAYTVTQVIGSGFRPQHADWRTERMNLQSVIGNSSVRFKFELTAGGGNNFYIDSVVVTGVTATGGRIRQAIALSPVPATDELNVSLPSTADYTYIVHDALGRRMMAGTAKGSDLHLDVRNLTSGAYLISLTQNGETSQQRFIVQHGAQ